MDAIVSGKVAKPEGSLGVFKHIYSYLVPDDNAFVSISVDSDIAQNFISKNYYVKFVTATSQLYLVSLVACSSSESVADRADASQLKILDGPIRFEYFYNYNVFYISTASRFTYPKDFISSIKIGTLE